MNWFQTALTVLNEPVGLSELITGQKYEKVSDETVYDQKFVPLENVNLDDQNEAGNTLLHLATMLNNHVSLAVLLKAGANPNITNLAGDTPALIAIQKKFLRCLTVLCHYKCDINIKDSHGKTCMDYAVMQIDPTQHNDGDGCNILISAGADVSKKYVPTTKTRTPYEEMYDEFGFLLENEKRIQAKNSKETYQLYRDHFDALHQRDLYRIEKFTKMCKTSKYGALYRKFQNRVRKGIPNGVRYLVWQCLMPISDLKSKNQGAYKKLYESEGVGKVLQQIDKDVNRCCRDHYLFQDRYCPHQVKLFHLLKAYSIHNKDVEYTQGMSTIAATLLMYLEEEDAFWAFCHLMSHPSFSFATLFMPGFPKLMETYYILDNLMKKHVPKVQKVISKSLDGMSYDMYLDLFFRKWILLIMNGSLPFEVSIHIFDVVISEGFDSLLIILIAIFKMYQNEFLSKKSMEELKFYIQEFDNKAIDFELFLKTIQSSKVTKKQIATFRTKYSKVKK